MVAIVHALSSEISRSDVKRNLIGNYQVLLYMLDMDIGTRISEARQARGLTQKQVAEALWVSVQAVSLWEKNKSTPKGERLSKLSQVLGVDQDFLSGKSSSPSATDTGDKSSDIPVLPLSKMMLALVESREEARKHQVAAVNATFKIFGHAFALQLSEGADGSGFKSGDILIFDSGIVPHEGDLCIVGISEIDKTQKVEKLGRREFSVPMTMRINIQKLRRKQSDETSTSGTTREDAGIEPGKKPSVIAVMVEHRSFRDPVDPPDDEDWTLTA